MQEKANGRPRSDFIIAPGLFPALDAHTCQNRQNAAVVDATGGFGGSVGFVTGGSRDDQQSLDDGMPDNGGTGQMPTVVAA
jgi:hypothetical protein